MAEIKKEINSNEMAEVTGGYDGGYGEGCPAGGPHIWETIEVKEEGMIRNLHQRCAGCGKERWKNAFPY